MQRRRGNDGARSKRGQCDRMPVRGATLRQEVVNVINFVNDIHPPFRALDIIMLMTSSC